MAAKPRVEVLEARMSDMSGEMSHHVREKTSLRTRLMERNSVCTAVDGM